MSKPHGVRIAIGEQGLDMYVPRITRTEDKIWEAVEEAIAEGWTAERFRREAADSWRQRMRDQAEWDREGILKGSFP